MPIFGKTKTEEVKKTENKSVPSNGTVKKSATKKSMKDLYAEENKGKSPVVAAIVDTEAKAEVKKTSHSSAAYRVLLRPLLTEKGSHLGIENKYLFEVGYNTNKIEISHAVENVYGVKPVKVNIVKMAGKIVRRGKYEGRRKNWKKAIVTLPKGKTIQIYEGI
jgi:large subunit ribosomal protein L23